VVPGKRGGAEPGKVRSTNGGKNGLLGDANDKGGKKSAKRGRGHKSGVAKHKGKKTRKGGTKDFSPLEERKRGVRGGGSSVYPGWGQRGPGASQKQKGDPLGGRPKGKDP